MNVKFETPPRYSNDTATRADLSVASSVRTKSVFGFTWSGGHTRTVTSRKMPLPGYQRDDFSTFSASTSRTFPVGTSASVTSIVSLA